MIYPEMIFFYGYRLNGEQLLVKGVVQVMRYSIPFIVGYVLVASTVLANPSLNPVSSLYDKAEVMILMRDGVELFTAIYTPKQRTEQYPILLYRTPYSIGDYGSGTSIHRRT